MVRLFHLLVSAIVLFSFGYWENLHAEDLIFERSSRHPSLDQGGENCATAVDLSGMPLPIVETGTTAGHQNDYTAEGLGEFPPCWAGYFEAGNTCAGPDVVYKYTAPSNGTYTISLCGSSYDTGLLIYNFTCPDEPSNPDDYLCGNEDSDNCENFESELVLNLDLGQELLIVVDGYFDPDDPGDFSGDYVLTISPYTPPPPVPGDNCESPFDLSGQALPLSVPGSTEGFEDDYSAYDLGEEAPPNWQGTGYNEELSGYAPDVVYSFVAPENSLYSFHLCASADEFDSDLLIYEFTCPVEPLNPTDFIAGSDNSCGIHAQVDGLHLDAGQRILIVVDGTDYSFGEFVLDISSTPPPPPMSGLVLLPQGSNIVLNWAPIEGYDQYAVYRSQSSDVTATPGTEIAIVTGTTYIDVGIITDPIPTFFYVVTGIFFPANPPASPSNLRLGTVTPNSVQLIWDDNSADETSFHVFAAEVGSGFSEIASVPANTLTFLAEGLIMNTCYVFKVRASNSAGYSSFSNWIDYCTPSPTQQLTCIEPIGGQEYCQSQPLRIAWEYEGPTVDRWQIGYSTNGGQSYDFTVPDHPSLYESATRHYDWTYPYCGPARMIRVWALDQNGNPLPVENNPDPNPNGSFDFVTCPRNAPTNLRVDNTWQTQLDIRWDDNANNETAYRIAMSTDAVNFTNVGEVGPNTVWFRASGLNCATTYWFKVRAAFECGYSDYSNTVDVTTRGAPDVPSNLRTVNIWQTQMDLRWDDNSGNEDYFWISQSSDGSNFTNIAQLEANTVTFRVTGLTCGTPYWFRVRGSNECGFSEYAPTLNVSTRGVPESPTNLRTVNVWQTQMDLRWDDNSGNEDYFWISQSSDGSNFTNIAQLEANTVTFRVTGLTCGTPYWFRVRGSNECGFSEYAPTLNVSTRGVPESPTNLASGNIGRTFIDMSWTDNSGNEDEFRIAISTDGVNFSNDGTTPPNDNTYRSSGLSPNTWYWFRVRARNECGVSGWTNTIHERTDP